jgi:hypothetical protein
MLRHLTLVPPLREPPPTAPPEPGSKRMDMKVRNRGAPSEVAVVTQPCGRKSRNGGYDRAMTDMRATERLLEVISAEGSRAAAEPPGTSTRSC